MSDGPKKFAGLLKVNDNPSRAAPGAGYEMSNNTDSAGPAEATAKRLLLTIALYGLTMVMAWAGYLLVEAGDWRGALVGACSLLQWAVVRAVDSP